MHCSGYDEKRSFLVNSGAEAVENAVKIARYATGRSAVVAFDHGFHGRTLLAMTLTGKAMPYKRGFGPFAPEVYRMPYSDPFRGTGRLEDVVSSIETTVGRDAVACIVVEPIAGEGGFVIPEPGWLAGLAEWCERAGALLVVDEIQSGMGRTGTWFACEHDGVVPDLMTTAKSLGGRPARRRHHWLGRRHGKPCTEAAWAGRSGATRWPAPWRWPCSTSSSRRASLARASHHR